MSTNRYDGYDLDALGAGATPAGTPSAQHVYVAPSGNDANPGTVAQPKATLAGAYAILPRLLSGPFVVHLASGTYIYATPPASLVISREAFVAVVGDGAGQVGDDGFVLRATGTVDAGSTVDLIKTTGTLSAGAYVGSTLEMTSGQAVGCRRGIADNSTTEIAPSFELTHFTNGSAVTAATGDTFRILRPAVRFQINGDVDVNGRTQLQLVNVSFFGSGRLLVDSVGDAQLQWYGVELDQTVSMFTLAQPGLCIGTAPSPVDYTRLATATGGNSVNTNWRGWGLLDPPTGASRWVVSVGTCALSFFICSVNGRVGALSTSQFCDVIIWGGRLASLWMANGGNWRTNALTCPLLLSPVNTTAALAAGLGARVVLYGKLRIAQAYNGQSCAATDTAVMQFHTTSFRISTAADASFPALDLSGISAMAVHGSVEITCSAGGAALSVSEKARLYVYTVTAVQGGSSQVTDAGEIQARSLTLSGGTGPALQVLGAGHVEVGTSTASAVLSLSCSAPGAGALHIAPGASFVHNTPPGSLNITNTSTAADSDGVRCLGEMTVGVVSTANVNVTTQGSTGYGVNCRGGGRFRCASQPTGIVGPTADFSIGTGAGEDFADTELATSFAAKASGGSLVQRTA